jgi:hypothetical protein
VRRGPAPRGRSGPQNHVRSVPLEVLWAAILSVALSLAAPAAGRGAVRLGVAAGTRTFDGLSVAEIRPRPQGELTCEGELDYVGAAHWGVAVSGRFGGAWFDYGGPGVSGKIEENSWSVRFLVDRHMSPSRTRSFRLGAGYEYGEARSWVHNYNFSDEGPHAFLSGVIVRLGLAQSLANRLQLYGDIEQSAYRAHAKDVSPANEYNWLGRAFKATVGIRIVLLDD